MFLGGDDRRRVHGGVRSSGAQRRRTRQGGLPDGPGHPGRRKVLHDHAPAGLAALRQDRRPQRSGVRRSRRPEDAALLPLRRHRQHCVQDGILGTM